jgi:peptidoglycan/LPS O-acetylase OafA/YrhL
MTATNPSLAPRAWNRIDGIDLLRGLSILFVLMNHVNMRLLFAHVPYTKGLPHQLVSSLVWNGQQGVQIFFVISGFLITSTSIRRWSSPSSLNLRDFYLLRFARIAPLMLLVLFIPQRHASRSPSQLRRLQKDWSRPRPPRSSHLPRQRP